MFPRLEAEILVRKLFWLTVFLLLSLTAGAHPGVGMVMDSRGNVYYTDLKHVWKIAPDGTKSIAVPNVHTHELCLDAHDNLYGEHLWYEGDATKKWGHRVWRLSPDGTLADVIPAREGFLQNYSFVRDRAGNMYWADRRRRTVIRKHAPDGRTSDVAPGADFRDVRWMISSPEGVLYLIDDDHLRRISPDGSVSILARNLKERRLGQFFVNDQHTLMGLWLDGQGNVLVAVYGAGLVKKVSADGRVTVVARSPFPWSPTGGLVAPDGDLWLLEYSLTNAARVRRIGKDGAIRAY